MADIEDIGTISGIGNYSPSGGVILPNDSPYASILANAPEYQYFTAPLSNKGNPTSYFSNNNIAVAPDTPVRVVDLATGKVAYEGTGYLGAQNAINTAQSLSSSGGNKANWDIQIVPPGGSSYQTVAHEKTNQSFTDTALQVLSVAAQIGVAVATQGASLGVQMAANGATAAAFTIAQGGSLTDAIKAGVMAAAPALGAKELGPLVEKGLNVSTPLVAKSIGAGISTAAAGALTGQSLGDLAVSGAIAGISTYAMPTVASGLKDLGINLSGANASGGGGGGGDAIVVTGSTAPGVAPVVNTGGKTTTTTKNADNVGADGTITVTGNQVAGIGGTGTTGSTATKSSGGGELPENLLVEGQKTSGTTVTSTGSTPTKQTGTQTPEDLLVEGDKNKVQITPDLSLSMQDLGKLINSPEYQDTINKEIAKDPSKKDLSVVDWLRLGVLSASLIGSIVGSGSNNDTVVGIGTGGGVVPIVPLNRTQNTVTGGTAGLGAYGFNPFTYGQSTGNQPGEYSFFGGPSTTAGIGGVIPGGTTGGTTGSAASKTTTTNAGIGGGGGGGGGNNDAADIANGIRPAGFTGVMPNQKVGDKQVVDGKTYVWGGFDKGWQWLATNDNGEQVLMPTGGATNISSIDAMMKSGVMRPANEAELARWKEITNTMTAADNAKTAAEANKILPGVYFDIDAATAKAIGKPELVGTQMSMRELQDAKLAAEAAQRAQTAAQIPAQIKAAQTAPAGTTAQSYYTDYVTPLAASYYKTGQFDATKARGLQQAVEPFVGKNDLAGAQGAVTSYLSSLGIAPGMADGGEVDQDEMVKHLIAYHKNGGHQGPGRVKGIGSGQEDKIPAWLSDGEYVWSAQDVADLGDGSTDEGVRRLDKMRQMVRKQAGRKDVKKIAKPQRGIDEMLRAVGGRV